MFIFFFLTAQPGAIFKALKNETSVACWELLNADILPQIRQPASCILLTRPAFDAFSRLNFVTERQNSVSLSHQRYDALLSATVMFVLLTHRLAAVSIRAEAYMYLFAPLAEEFVCVCVFEPIRGEDSVTLLRGPIHSAAGFCSVVLLLENTSCGTKSEPELSRKLKSALERHCERNERKGVF